MNDVLSTPPSCKSNPSKQIPIDLLNDLSSRFIINVPEEERVDLIRVCFQIELAHWFYLDFYCEEDAKLPKCSVKDFIRIIFAHIPFLQKYSAQVDSIISDWREYKMAVPTYGAILLDQELKNALLVQSFVSKGSWGFPKGKVNKDELPHHCAIREVLEETGFDISHLIDKDEFLEYYFNDQLIRLYIITGIPPNVKFHPKTRKEIKDIEWFPVNSLPTSRKDQMCKTSSGSLSFYMVVPFVKPLKKWIASMDKTTSIPEQSYTNHDEAEKLIMQQNLFAKLSQNEFSKYKDFKAPTEDNHPGDHRTNHSSRTKSTYTPPPRMLRQKNLKLGVEYEKKKNNQSQTEEKSHSKNVKRALDFSKENKLNKEKSYMKNGKYLPYSKTWANISLDTEALVATFSMNLKLLPSVAKG